MTEMIVTRQTTAPVSAVWEVLTAVEQWDQVMSGIEQVERLDDGEEFGPGVRWRETRTMFGKQATEEMEVTEVDLASHSYVVEAASHGALYRSTMTVTPAGDGSTISMSFSGEPQGLVSKVLARTVGKAFEGATRKALQQDLDDIAVAAEARAAGA